MKIKFAITVVALSFVLSACGVNINTTSSTPIKSIEGATKEAPEKTDEKEYTVDGFKISEVSVKGSGGIWMLTAEVENTGKDIGGAIFKATISDKSGKRLGAADGAVMKMKKGESKTVDFTFLDDLISMPMDVDGYDSFKFQVDGTF